ncbi:hypothetical protein KVT40_002009 [Elsinoe batatas]|uniref:Glycoside hydrolase family 2 domain-containing protein n=1 Tax=Elsinoe batatas TaxID=2601811 RepID=A0A8K0PFJ5_9PEZI|nr:hypothetical protein KVT40_002009 [Elsinoe batatas]
MGEEWADAKVETTGEARGLEVSVDREEIMGDGVDLGYVTVEVVDGEGRRVPDAEDEVTFEVEGGELVATDNGDPADLRAFPEKTRNAYSGLVLGIVRSGEKGTVKVRVSAPGLKGAEVDITATLMRDTLLRASRSETDWDDLPSLIDC